MKIEIILVRKVPLLIENFSAQGKKRTPSFLELNRITSTSGHDEPTSTT